MRNHFRKGMKSKVVINCVSSPGSALDEADRNGCTQNYYYNVV